MIRAGTDGPVKIGWSKRPAVRKTKVQPEHYLELILLREIDCPASGERTLHKYFQPDRIRGEWFSFNPEMLTITIEDAVIEVHARRKQHKLDSAQFATMLASDLKAWRDRCNLSDKEAAAALALSLQGFRNQMYGCTPVSKRTVRMTELVEQQQDRS